MNANEQAKKGTNRIVKRRENSQIFLFLSVSSILLSELFSCSLGQYNCAKR